MLRGNLSAAQGFDVTGRRAEAPFRHRIKAIGRHRLGKHQAKNLWG